MNISQHKKRFYIWSAGKSVGSAVFVFYYLIILQEGKKDSSKVQLIKHFVIKANWTKMKSDM